MSHIMDINETDLYHPVKTYLEHNGYTVNAEAAHCDIIARKDDEIVIIELKKIFSLKLIYQGIDRQKISDSVYLAIPVAGGKYPKTFRQMRHLIRRLELGLIFVHFLRNKRTRVEIIEHPERYQQHKSSQRKRALIRECSGRVSELNIGGSAGKTKLTLYRQLCIEIAVFLDLHGESSPKKLVNNGCSEKSQAILSRNYYGWFVKESRGIYTLHEEGKKALTNYPDLVSHFKEQFYQQQ